MNALLIFKRNGVWDALTIIFIILVFVITLISNLNLESSQGLWIDEEITFFPIQKILQPFDLSEFWWLISEGGDYRYGRSLWNMMAAFSYFPAKIWGPVGQIIGGRQLQVLLLLLSFWLLSQTFIRTGYIKFLFVLTLCVIPYSSYYMSMPKPEPELLFFAALFLYFYVKNRGTLGGIFWIFLGLSMGSKISFLPPALIFFGISLYLTIQNTNFKEVYTKAGLSLFFIAIGFCLAIPVFFKLLILASYPILVLIFLFKAFSKKNAVATFLGIIIFIVALLQLGLIPSLKSTSVLEVLLPMKLWYLSTLGSVNEGGLGPNYNLINWLAFIPRQWLKTPFILGYFYMSILGYCVLMCAYRIYRFELNRENGESTLLNAALLIISVAMLASPMLSVKNRLWGMYLYPGFIFLLTYLFSSLDSHLRQSFNEPILQIKNHISNIGKGFLTIILLSYALLTSPAQFLSNLSVIAYVPSIINIGKSDKFNLMWNKNVYPMTLIVTIIFTLILVFFFWMPSWASDFYYMTYNNEKFYSRPWLIGM